jgi:hypothetical protein
VGQVILRIGRILAKYNPGLRVKGRIPLATDLRQDLWVCHLPVGVIYKATTYHLGTIRGRRFDKIIEPPQIRLAGGALLKYLPQELIQLCSHSLQLQHKCQPFSSSSVSLGPFPIGTSVPRPLLQIQHNNKQTLQPPLRVRVAALFPQEALRNYGPVSIHTIFGYILFSLT